MNKKEILIGIILIVTIIVVGLYILQSLDFIFNFIEVKLE